MTQPQSPPNARDIAEGLTKAQRRAFSELPGTFTIYPVSIARVTIKRLIDKGLIERRAPASGFGFVIHTFTPLGEQVRSILMGRDGNE